MATIKDKLFGCNCGDCATTQPMPRAHSFAPTAPVVVSAMEESQAVPNDDFIAQTVPNDDFLAPTAPIITIGDVTFNCDVTFESGSICALVPDATTAQQLFSGLQSVKQLGVANDIEEDNLENGKHAAKRQGQQAQKKFNQPQGTSSHK